VLVGASCDQVVFTSGATEANNHAVRAAARLARRDGRAVLGIPSHEHPSLLHPARSLARCGFGLHAVAVGRDGLLDPCDLPLDELGALGLSLAHAELGALQPIREIADAARAGAVRIVVDATLAAGRVGVVMKDLGEPDILTLSFHHLGGPMGVGALVMGPSPKWRDVISTEGNVDALAALWGMTQILEKETPGSEAAYRFPQESRLSEGTGFALPSPEIGNR